MSDDDDLRINTLHRFAKHSPRLTLQEYSHCEVPAGCGGVVLRWVDPSLGPCVRVRVVGIGTVETWMDGRRLIGDRVPLGPGRHVLALHFQSLGRMIWRKRQLELPAPLPAAVALYTDTGPRSPAHNTLGDTISERWMPGPLTAPPVEPDLDDRSWRPLERARPGLLGRLPSDVRPSFDQLANSGMTMIAIGDDDAPLEEAWVRIAFAVTA